MSRELPPDDRRTEHITGVVCDHCAKDQCYDDAGRWYQITSYGDEPSNRSPLAGDYCSAECVERKTVNDLTRDTRKDDV